jgi:hypothetical protein
MMKRIALLAAILLLTAGALAAQPPAQAPAPVPPKPDPWLALRFLIGSWQSKTTGGVAQAQAAASYTFQLELSDHVLARHSRSGACVATDDFDCQHNDLLYIYPAAEGQGFQAIYLDNEGHVIHYTVSVPKPATVVFLSDPSQLGPQYRLTYSLLEGVMSGLFELQIPGQTQFTSYLEWSGKKR